MRIKLKNRMTRWSSRGLTSALDSTMKLLHSAQEYFQILGIQPPQGTRDHPFNAKNIFVLFFMSYVLILLTCGLIECESIAEYGLSVYLIVVVFALVVDFAVCVWESTSFFKFFKEFEGFIEKRNNY